MARTMKLDQTTIYRALIQHRETVDHEWVDLEAYGPYDSKSGCRDHGGAWRRKEVAAGLRRRVTQVQDVGMSGENIVWVDCD